MIPSLICIGGNPNDGERRPNLDDEFSSDKHTFWRWAGYFSMSAARWARWASSESIATAAPSDRFEEASFIRIGFKDIEDVKGCRHHSGRMATALHKHSCFFAAEKVSG
jgi:hypothetical protein